jgi:CheY-like chemotaxis protein
MSIVQTKQFDVIVSDIGLPDGSGLDLMTDLRQRMPRARAIALSGYGTEDDVTKSRSSGFDAHLTKPVNFDELLQTLDRLRMQRG